VSARRNEIYLADFPFSDSEASKPRPVVILSNNRYNSEQPDVVVCGITTNSGHQCFLNISECDLEHGKLYEGSGLRADLLARISKDNLYHRVGKITEEFRAKAISRILDLIR